MQKHVELGLSLTVDSYTRTNTRLQTEKTLLALHEGDDRNIDGRALTKWAEALGRLHTEIRRRFAADAEKGYCQQAVSQ